MKFQLFSLIGWAITNYSEDHSSNITFKYNVNATDASELQVVLEVGTPEDAPWALGTEDEVNGIKLEMASGQWQQNGGTEQIKVGSEVKALRWTFIPKEEDVVLTAQDTILIALKGIVTSHPTGESNLYLYYKKVEGYKDGKYICQIEKAPVAFDQPKDKKGTVRGVSFAGVGALVRGMIIAWNGEETPLPQGWHLCNGDVVDGYHVPDLRASFIVGARLGREEVPDFPLGGVKGEYETMLEGKNLPPIADRIENESQGKHEHRPKWKVGRDKTSTEVDEDRMQRHYYIEAFKGEGHVDKKRLTISEDYVSSIPNVTEERIYESLRLSVKGWGIEEGDSTLMWSIQSEEDGDHSHELRDKNGLKVEPISLIPRCYALCYIIYLGR